MRWRSARETAGTVAGGIRRMLRWVLASLVLAGLWAGAGTPAAAAVEGGWSTSDGSTSAQAAAERAADERAAGPWASPTVTQRGSWAWPVPSHVVTAPYAAPATRYAAGHRGIDLAAPPGSVVTAPDDAVVRFVGVVVDRPVLTLDHGDGVLSSYEPVASEMTVGSVVGRGAVIGSVAAGGHCDGGCLHVGVRIAGEYVSPLLFFAKVPPSILLPLGSG